MTAATSTLDPKSAWKDRYLKKSRNLRAKDLPLDEYLRQHGQAWVLDLRKLLDAVDWTLLRPSTLPAGRFPYPPDVLVGLYIYGLLVQTKPSLRSLERLAVTDVGAWHICGGLEPSYSKIGKFFVEYAGVLQKEFFLNVTQQLLQWLEVTPTEVSALDGTVIEASASRHGLLSANSVRQKLQELNERLDEEPDSLHIKRKIQRTEEAGTAIAEREKKEAGAKRKRCSGQGVRH